MPKTITFDLSRDNHRVWNCITRGKEDYTGLGLTADEAYCDWLESNYILVDCNGNHYYAEDLD